MSQDPGLSRNPDYYSARAAEELRLAMAAEDRHVRAIHLEMADRYARLAESGGQEPGKVIGDQKRMG